MMDRHFSMQRMAVFGGLAFIVCGAASMAAGWMSDAWIANGATPNGSRKTFGVAALRRDFAGLGSRTRRSGDGAAHGNICGNRCVHIQRLDHHPKSGGTQSFGQWTGLQNAIGNVGSVVSPIVTGWIVASTGRFSLAFLAASAGLLVAAAMYLFGIGRTEPQWTAAEEFHQ